MQIGQLLPGYPDLARTEKQYDAVKPVEGQGARLAELVQAGANEQMAEFGRIVSRYDVSEITPHDFSLMIQQLFEAGALSDQDLKELAQIRLDLDFEGIDDDEEVDLVELFVEKLRDLQRKHAELAESGAADAVDQADRPPPLGPYERRLEWLRKFALIQSEPDMIGISALV